MGRSLPATHKIIRELVPILLVMDCRTDILFDAERIAEFLNFAVDVHNQQDVRFKFTGKEIVDAFTNQGETEYTWSYKDRGWTSDTSLFYVRLSKQYGRGTERRSGIGRFPSLEAARAATITKAMPNPNLLMDDEVSRLLTFLRSRPPTSATANLTPKSWTCKLGWKLHNLKWRD